MRHVPASRGISLVPADGRVKPVAAPSGDGHPPPALYLGFVSFVVPFAFAIAALATGKVDDRWIRVTRKWTLVAWLFLSLGLVLGNRWAYDVLGWGGYWGWGTVEIAALMPWLSGTAFLHSVMIQERKGMFKRWNMILIIRHIPSSSLAPSWRAPGCFPPCMLCPIGNRSPLFSRLLESRSSCRWVCFYTAGIPCVRKDR